MLSKFTGPGLFRLFLALAVFATHTTRIGFGASAVQIFFCLSGYWIYTMYVDSAQYGDGRATLSYFCNFAHVALATGVLAHYFARPSLPLFNWLKCY